MKPLTELMVMGMVLVGLKLCSIHMERGGADWSVWMKARMNLRKTFSLDDLPQPWRLDPAGDRGVNANFNLGIDGFGSTTYFSMGDEYGAKEASVTQFQAEQVEDAAPKLQFVERVTVDVKQPVNETGLEEFTTVMAHANVSRSNVAPTLQEHPSLDEAIRMVKVSPSRACTVLAMLAYNNLLAYGMNDLDSLPSLSLSTATVPRARGRPRRVSYLY